MSASSDKNRVLIFDTTMRDGEQSPGASMNLDEKLRIAEVLEGMGVDIIEAGFPIASDGDFEAVNEIAKMVKNSIVCGLARATKIDIDRCADAVKPAERSRIHTFIATSPLHMKHKLQMEPKDVLAQVSDSYQREVRLASERLLTLLEPTLTVLLGGLLLWMVSAVLGPVYSALTRLGASA